MKMSVEHWWNETDREKLTYVEKSLSNTNLTYTGLGFPYKLPVPWLGQKPGVELTWIIYKAPVRTAQ